MLRICLCSFAAETDFVARFSEMHDDIAILEDVFKDNIDEGKSIEYFRWAVKTLPDPKPQFSECLWLIINREAS